MAERLTNIETYAKADELMRICRTAVRKAQAKNRRLGIANVYTLNGQRYFERPDGELTRTRPNAFQDNGG